MQFPYRLLFLSLLFSASPSMAAESLCPAQPQDSSFRWVRTEGPDFDVCRAISVKNGEELFGLYLGNHPSFKPAPELVAERSRIGKTEVTWYFKSPEKQKAVIRETVVALPSKSFPQFVHIWFSAAEARELQIRFKQIGELNLGL